MKKLLLLALSIIGLQATTLVLGNNLYDFAGKLSALKDGILLESGPTKYPKIQTLGHLSSGLFLGFIQPFVGFHGIEDEDGASYMLNGTPKAFNYAVAAGVLSWIPGLAIAYFSGYLKNN